MTRRVLSLLGVIFVGSVTELGVPSVSAQTSASPKEVQSKFDIVESPVLRVFSAEVDGHRFLAYLVKWKDSEVIVKDPSNASHFQAGDKIPFMVIKGNQPGPISFYLDVSRSARSRDRLITYDFLEAPVQRVFSAEVDGHRFVAYLVKWKDSEVIVSDSSAKSHFSTGDKIRFTVMKAIQSGPPKKLDDVTFILQNDAERIVLGDLDVSKSETERFLALPGAAKNALNDGDTEKAEALATELLHLVPKYPNNGGAIQVGNQVLGRIAISKGDVEEAKNRLLASADSKGSPVMNSFGPNMQLAKALLENGEKDVVLEYFKRCGKFWKFGEQQLGVWEASVKKGEMPEFGANLNY